ncbi:MAG: class I SAM-dependent methyltransferase [Saccharofermentanales bacterium]
MDNVIRHYDAIIDEIDDPSIPSVVDPAHDPEPLRAYMDKWDGEPFIEALQLAPDKEVLEIGIGTGRLALRVCPRCGHFTGIDFSPKTIGRAKENLHAFANTELIGGDFLTHPFEQTFDVIYSSLTFMHIREKQAAIQKAADLLAPGGRFVLSISKNQETIFDYGSRQIELYPDTPAETGERLANAGLTVERQFDTEFAVIFVAVKGTAT